jgi:2-oxoglutarate dehydrogenase complex dehydrogenase (E1) component-like enzyme
MTVAQPGARVRARLQRRDKDALVLWEAPLGDFATGAQVVIDTFFSAGEDKWGQQSGLVQLLPHGYEGQGPEHSSARIERFLQLSAEHNWQIVVPSTPAQYFHVLRRQALSEVKKPLVVFTPKSLLRLKETFSPASELTEGAFQPVIEDPSPPKKVERVVLSQGKFYWDLAKAREDKPIALVRVEEPTGSRQRSYRVRSGRGRTPRWSGPRRSPRAWAAGPSWNASSASSASSRKP